MLVSSRRKPAVPVTYRIDPLNGLIRTTCRGAVTLQEVVGHFGELRRSSACPKRLDVLLNLSEQTSVPAAGNLRDVTKAIGSVRSKVEFGICAIVAGTDVLFGMLRMFEVFAERHFRETHVFRGVEEAELWLATRRKEEASHGAAR